MFAFMKDSCKNEEKSGSTTPAASIRDEVSSHADSDEPEYLHGVKLLVILLALSLTTFLVGLDSALISTAIPSLSSSFSATEDIGWYGASYSLALCSLQPLAGKIAAVFPIKTSFLCFEALFILGSILCGIATSSNFFIMARAVAGAGAAGLVSNALVIVTIISPLSKRALYTSILYSTFSISTIAGPLVGGALTDGVSWRWCFYLNAPVGGATFAVLVFFFRPPERKPGAHLCLLQKLGKLDLLGCVMFVPAIVMALLALQWGGHQHDWNSATIIGLFGGFAGVIIIFLGWEYHIGDDAMMPFSMLLNRSVLLCCLSIFFAMGSVATNTYYLPEWFQVVKEASPIHSGVMNIPGIISLAIFMMVSGAIVNRTGVYNVNILLGTALLSVGSGLFSTFTTTTSHERWIPYQLFHGIGGGFTLAVPLIAVQAILGKTPHKVPVGVAQVLFFQYFGAAVFVSVALTIFQNRLIGGLKGDVGLDDGQIGALLVAGTGQVREVAAHLFPTKIGAVLEAYNNAITSTFYLPCAGAGVAFLLALGIEWKNTRQRPSIPKGDEAGAGASIGPAQENTRPSSIEVEVSTAGLEKYLNGGLGSKRSSTPWIEFSILTDAVGFDDSWLYRIMYGGRPASELG